MLHQAEENGHQNDAFKKIDYFWKVIIADVLKRICIFPVPKKAKSTINVKDDLDITGLTPT